MTKVSPAESRSERNRSHGNSDFMGNSDACHATQQQPSGVSRSTRAIAGSLGALISFVPIAPRTMAVETNVNTAAGLTIADAIRMLSMASFMHLFYKQVRA